MRTVLEQCADVIALEPDEISAEVVRDADALIIRTRTRCNEALLEGSRIQFIATATIGFDHIDTAYCAQQNIRWMSCPGCNAQGVCDYVETAIRSSKFKVQSSPTIGIVGCGNVGQKVMQMAKRMGWRVLVSDPPREERDEIQGVSLTTIAREADIITFHTPLTPIGKHATYHLADATFFGQLKPNTLIINAARGGVIDEIALIDYLHTHPQAQAAIDCWENEPNINHELLKLAAITTYHIAGYTQDGKYNASEMCLRGLIEHFSLDKNLSHRLITALQQQRIISTEPQVGFAIQHTSAQLKNAPEQFEALRQAYPLR